MTEALSGAPGKIEATPNPATHSSTSEVWQQLRHNPVFVLCAALMLVFVAMAVFPQAFAGWFGHGDPRDCDLSFSRVGPQPGHPFGFDSQGCDLYANVIYGARAAMLVGVLSASLTFLIAIVLGSLSGYFGGAIDVVISRVGDIFFGFPFMLGALILLILIPQPNAFTLIGVLVLFGWPYLTRVTRANVMKVKNYDFVVATRALGASDARILTRHVIPNAIAPTLVLASLSVGGYIVAEAALTYIGLGLRYPTISWGLQLAGANSALQHAPHMLLFPALFLSVTVLVFVLVGDAVRDALNPRLR